MVGLLPEAWQSVQPIATILGGIVVVGGLVYKVLSGWLFTNLQVLLRARRELDPDGQDLLVLEIELEKGNNDALRLDYVGVRLRPPAKTGGNIVGDATYLAIDARALESGSASGPWTERQPRWAFSLAPGDRTHFAEKLGVEANKAYNVELLVLGHAFLRPGSQSVWRASTVAPPRSR